MYQVIAMSCNEISALFSTNNKHAITWYNSQIIIYKNMYNIYNIVDYIYNIVDYIYNKLIEEESSIVKTAY